MRDQNKTKKSGRCKFAFHIQSTLNGFLVQILRSSLVTITSNVYTEAMILFNLGVNSGRILLYASRLG